MARVEERDRCSLPTDLRPLWDAFTRPEHDFTNQARVLAQSHPAFRHLYGLIDTWRTDGSLPRRLVEIAVVTTSRLNACPYCIGHHGAVLAETGLPAETVNGILDPEVPGLDALERLVRDFSRLLVERPWGMPDSIFAALRRHLDERQIVELTLRVGVCSLFNTFNQALQIEMEPSARSQLDRCGIEIGMSDVDDRDTSGAPRTEGR